MAAQGQLVSLAEPVKMIKEGMREYQKYALNNDLSIQQIEALRRSCAYDYDSTAYFNQLMFEIMRNAGNPEMFNQTSPSTDILIAAGMDKTSAMTLALKVFDQMVDILSAFIPEASFGDFKGFDVTFINSRDVVIYPPPFIY